MTQSFHAGAATSSHARVLPNRRRTDLTPTVTAIDSGLGQPLSSREISRASTPGRRMLLSSTNGKSPGKAVSMSRLDQLARPRVLNLNKSQYTSPNEVSPSHAPMSLNNNARLNHRRSRVGQTPSKNISASMSQLNTQTKDTTTAPRLRDRPRPPLSASSATRTRSKIGDKGVEGRRNLIRLTMVAFNCGNDSFHGWFFCYIHSLAFQVLVEDHFSLRQSLPFLHKSVFELSIIVPLGRYIHRILVIRLTQLIKKIEYFC